ncbi:ABC transporter permease [Dyadobacter sp. LJ53]|uniref:ABC transporter permease n=1 Tax=Dyadobacter chenwenxiniae TaxID=2906456 RepID=UPI001F293429|nr:ABC transporter permease [Dyadobacter chenwenxiniae]MCF0049354.1 ABC transporter permease [Dyadobacter chenwenxiniae]
MITNYFKIASRNLWRHRGFSAINILGLATGMSACLLICLYVSFELSYDKFHSKANRIYRVVTDVETIGETSHKGSSWAYGPAMLKDFPEIESFVRLSRVSFLVRKGDAKFQEEKTLFADSTLFKVFDFKLISGNPQTALRDPLSIVFTQTAARKYFGDSDPVGQSVLLDAEGLVANVTGIVQDLPGNSQIKANMFLSASTMKRYKPDADSEWEAFEPMTYLLLKPNTSAEMLSRKFPAFLEHYAGKIMSEQKLNYSVSLEPLRDVYLHAKYIGGLETGNASYVYIFTAVAVFTMLIACINFVNLTTARSVERAKEVGMRKVVGAGRSRIAKQFISESVLVCLFAFVVSVFLTALLIPHFNDLAGKEISLGIINDYLFVVVFFIVAIGIGVLAGIYPALVLSSFQPALVLKGQFKHSRKGVFLRKALVISQFAISITLMIGTLIIYIQMNYIQNKDLGFSKNQILVLDTDADPNKEVLRHALSNVHGAVAASRSSSIPGSRYQNTSSQIESSGGDFQTAGLHEFLIDFDFIDLYKMKMVAGRQFSKEFATDSAKAMIINETAAKLFGYADSKLAIGKRFRQSGVDGEIIGVIKDFHFQSLEESVQPLAMRIEPAYCNLVSVKVSPADLFQTLKSIEEQWNKLMPNRPFSYFFMNEYFDRQYRSQQQFKALFMNFAFLTIFISCLGLIGLSSYAAVQRKKEVGVRKVLGGSTASIVLLFYKDFVGLVFAAFLIASPVAYYAGQKWLESFAYRTEIPLWIFIVVASLTMVIAIITTSFQSVRAAIENPVKVLKT